ncbi:MAG: type III-B CRISPR-associated protein Cas10/Cmr2 [Armatimonadetes bacterium JP3_11]|nr:MAG: type III-B CRISPR-associated protein Cas10/Cmr2 [Armatimonadetes bacterium JP3_11]RMH07605.1 MAG: type III-B CRISPR-associated protein Cas10/Cmr2 [Armatimonadota bacterium]
MRYLLTIALGPVQEFIAAARRTADLTAGSQLLSDIAQDIAQFLESQRATLIFPSRTQQAAPNKLLCIVEGEPHKIAQQAKERALQKLRAEWNQAFSKMSADVQQLIDIELVNWQLKNFLEFYAAWVPLNGDYKSARTRVEQILAGRKALRDFKQPYKYPRHPKSPLDPAMDSAFKTEAHGDGFSAPAAAQADPQLRLKPRETLDAISLIKRVRGERGVPSTREMAFRAFEEILPREALDAYRALQHWQEKLGIDDFSDLFYQENWRRLLNERIREGQRNLSADDLAEIEQSASKLHRALREKKIPYECLSYYAVLVADGDRMGETLNQMTTPEQHQAFSERLSVFAQEVQCIVDRHKGHLVYCGGDDVLALLPTDRALACAYALRQSFERVLQSVMPNGRRATLSAGIAIVHAMENLQIAIGWARQTEQQAKRTRDALAVARYPRSGGANRYSAPWERYEEWNTWTEAFHHGLADGFPYELRQLVAEYRALNPDGDLLRREVNRVLARKQKPNLPLEIPAWVTSIETLDAFVEMLLIARFLAGYKRKEASP